MIALLLAMAVQQSAEDITRVAWGSCLNRFAEDGSLTVDPANLIIDAAFLACDADESAFKLAWKKMMLERSVIKWTEQEATEKTAETATNFANRWRSSMLVRIQRLRQIAALKNEQQRLRDEGRRILQRP